MYHLVYLSTPVERLDDSDYLKILNTAHKNNRDHGVTGMLLASEAYFMQLLEGERHAVVNIFNKISRDKRHSNIFILEAGSTEERLFEDWRMGFDYMNWLSKARKEALSPILKCPEWRWSKEELKKRPIYLLNQFRQQFSQERSFYSSARVETEQKVGA